MSADLSLSKLKKMAQHLKIKGYSTWRAADKEYAIAEIQRAQQNNSMPNRDSPSLEDLSVSKLKKMAKDLKIKGYSTWKPADKDRAIAIIRQELQSRRSRSPSPVPAQVRSRSPSPSPVRSRRSSPVPPRPSPDRDSPSLEDLSVSKLKKMAKDLKIKGYSTWKPADKDRAIAIIRQELQSRRSRSPSPVPAQVRSRSPSPVPAQVRSRSPSPVPAQVRSRSPSPVPAQVRSRSPSPESNMFQFSFPEQQFSSPFEEAQLLVSSLNSLSTKLSRDEKDTIIELFMSVYGAKDIQVLDIPDEEMVFVSPRMEDEPLVVETEGDYVGEEEEKVFLPDEIDHVHEHIKQNETRQSINELKKKMQDLKGRIEKDNDVERIEREIEKCLLQV